MVKVALFVRLEAKPGKEKEVESFLVSGLPIVNEEPATTAWFGIRLGPSTFGIFDAFPDEAGRQAHLSGKVDGQWQPGSSPLQCLIFRRYRVFGIPLLPCLPRA